MRQDELLLVQLELAEQQQVHVDRAGRMPPRFGLTAEPALDRLAHGEETVRFQLGADLSRRVVEVALPGRVVHRLGRINRGAGKHLEPVRRAQQLERPTQIREPVAYVRAEPEEAARQRVTSTETSSTGSGIGGSGFAARTTMPVA